MDYLLPATYFLARYRRLHITVRGERKETVNRGFLKKRKLNSRPVGGRGEKRRRRGVEIAIFFIRRAIRFTLRGLAARMTLSFQSRDNLRRDSGVSHSRDAASVKISRKTRDT